MSVRKTDRKNSHRVICGTRGRRTQVIALAALAALPTFVALQARASFNELNQALVYLADTAAPTDPETLTLGQAQFEQGNFEDALVTLQRVKTDALAPAQKDAYSAILPKVQNAVDQRKAARASFISGENALQSNDLPKALSLYKAAAENKFADGPTVAKANSQIELVKKAMGDSAPAAGVAAAPSKDNKALYKEAEADFNAGKYNDAKAKFTALKESGYKPGMFERDPDKWLSEIDKSQTKPADEAVVMEKDKGEAAYKAGKDAYENHRYDEARAQLAIARDAGYKAPMFQASPARLLEMIDEKVKVSTVAVSVSEPTASADNTTASSVITVIPAPSNPTETQLSATADAERIRKAALEYQANEIMTKAAEAEAQGRLVDAGKLYEMANQTDPSNLKAKAKFEEINLKVSGDAQGDMLSSELLKQDIVKQVIRSQIDKSSADFQAALKDKDFGTAAQSLDIYTVALYGRPDIWSATQMRDYQASLTSMKLLLQTAVEENKKVDEARNAAAIAKNIGEKNAAVEEERRRTIQQLIANCKELSLNAEYEKAQGVVKQILSIDPSNEYARAIEPLLGDRVIIKRERILMEQLDRSYEWQITEADELKIPYRDIINYPSNWPDISDRRDRETALERQPIGNGPSDASTTSTTAAPAVAMRALNNTMVSVKFEGVALQDAIGSLQDMAKNSNVNFATQWKTLQAAGIDRTTPVEGVTLRNIALKDALDAVLKSVSSPAARAAFRVNSSNGIVYISTADDFNETDIRVYDIQDLLAVAPIINNGGGYDYSSSAGGSIDPYSYNNNYNGYDPVGNMGYGGSGYGGSGYPGQRSNGYRYGNVRDRMGLMDPDMMRQRTDKMVQDITKTLTATIDYDSWKENGGRLGTMRFLQGQLVVSQTPDNQKKVSGLLDRLRESKSIQVCVETRFLQIQRNFLEDVGLDLDFFFNINNPQNWSPISVQQNTADITSGPTTTVPGSIATKQVNPSMMLSGSFLDDFQVNFLIRATQGANASTTVTAPRVTVFNGQMAYITVGTTQSYVSDLEAVPGVNVGLYNPVLGQTGSQVTLQVQPIVSADRKYVTLTLSPQITQLVSLENYTVYGQADNTNNNNGGDSTTSTFSGTIQEPITQTTQIQTMVSVPDGGTLLLGGQTLVAETEKEAGVPILSKIPIIKRLFTNRSTAKDEEVLLILVKPTIIIPREYEEKLFPTIGSRPIGR